MSSDVSFSSLNQFPYDKTLTELDKLLEKAFQDAYAQEEPIVLSFDESQTVQRAYSVPEPEIVARTAECIMQRYKEEDKKLFGRFMKEGFRRRASTPTSLREVRRAEELPSPSILNESTTPKPSLVLSLHSPTARKTDKAALRRLLTMPTDDDLPQPQTNLHN